MGDKNPPSQTVSGPTRLGSFAHELVVLQLLQREDMLVEILLEFLVGKVDVELLKPIDLRTDKHTTTHTEQRHLRSLSRSA